MSRSFSYDRYDRSSSRTRRTTLGYWVPLVLTVTVATAGIAAWIWSEREDDEDSGSNSDNENLSYGEESKREFAKGEMGPPPEYQRDVGYTGPRSPGREEGFMATMSGAIRRTPSPQQLFDGASRKVTAGIAAAGAALGGALSSIREEDKDDFVDHNRWSEEVERQNVQTTSAESSRAVDTHTEAFDASLKQGPTSKSLAPGIKRKTVALVVSADSNVDIPEKEQGAYHTEHASLLSHLPPINPSTTRLFVLIYAPGLKSRPSSSHAAPSSMGSSYSNLNTPAQTPGEELQSLDPQPYSGRHTPATTPALSAYEPGNAVFANVMSQAQQMVEKPAMAMPFSTPTGHVHMLRHLAPDLVYVTESLSGNNGSEIEAIRSWVGQVIVVVGDDGTGLGGLVDTEDEGEGRKEVLKTKWWNTSDMVGFGKGVEIVDIARVGDDFERRTGIKE